jgi:hypothetical protein
VASFASNHARPHKVHLARPNGRAYCGTSSLDVRVVTMAELDEVTCQGCLRWSERDRSR